MRGAQSLLRPQWVNALVFDALPENFKRAPSTEHRNKPLDQSFRSCLPENRETNQKRGSGLALHSMTLGTVSQGC